MTTEEKRLALIEMCRIGNKSPYNDCGMCRISDSCRKTGHPPEYMKDETVELVFNDSVEQGGLTMAREKPAFREILDRLDDAFPGREIIQQKELGKFLGLDVRTVKKYFSACESKLHPGYSKTKVARILAD